MTETDLSDKAADIEFKKRYAGYSGQRDDVYDISFWGGWKECRRRALAQIEQLQSEVVAAIDEKHWVENQLEQERREAFEAGFSKALYGTNGIDRDEAYRVFLQEREGK